MTTLELAVVITFLLALVSILFIGTRSWMRGSDRATCVLTQRNVQVAMRSYQNLYGYHYGGRPYPERGTLDIVEHLRSKGYIEESVYENARGATPCGAGGSYTRPLPEIFPAVGELYMHCALSETDLHKPVSHDDW
ncbi:MAG: type II secretion system protein [Luteolibacter sp.]